MNAETSAGLVRRWVALYTRGLPPNVRRDRRDEIADDIWSQLSEQGETGSGDGSVAGVILARLVLGIPADLSWRLAQRRPAPARIVPVRSSTMNARFVAAMAFAGGAGWLVWPIPQAIYGDAGWSPSAGSVAWLLFFSVVGGTWALALAVLGLVSGYADRIKGAVAVIGVLGALLGGVSVFGAFSAIVALPLGSAVVMWELGRIGALGVWLTRAHVASAMTFLVWAVALFTNSAILIDQVTSVALAALVLPYALTWIAIGWTLIHQPSSQRGPAAGA